MEALIGRRSITSEWAAIDVHRKENSPQSDVLTSVDWFLSKRDMWNEVPVVLLSRINGRLHGVVLLYYSKINWLPYGLARGGKRGDISVIGPPAHQREILETAAHFIVRHMFAHTVVFTVPHRVTPHATWASRSSKASLDWFLREHRYRLSLEGGWAATMQRLSYKLRRNLQYYRRRACVEAKVRFVPDLTAAQRGSAVAALATKGRYTLGLPLARKWDSALQAVPGAFAMGLQNAEGEWISYVVGWREPSGTYVDLQLNDETASAATVMRSFLIEHEIGRASPALVFVGGTSPIWERACEAAVASDLLVISRGPIGYVLRRAYQRLKPSSDVTMLYSRRSAVPKQPTRSMDDARKTAEPLL